MRLPRRTCGVSNGVLPRGSEPISTPSLKAFADHGQLGDILNRDGGDCETVLAQFAQADIDINAVAAKL